MVSKEYYKQYYKNNKDKYKKYQQKYNEKNKEKIKEIQKIYRENNKEKIKKNYYIYRKKNKETYKRNMLKRDHGITLEEFNKMKEEQNNVCYICGQPETKKNREKIKELAVDHNHKTGKIRKLLCYNCNVGLGYSKENPYILINMVKYLLKYKQQ